MAASGDRRPGEPWDRIRPAPRPVRAPSEAGAAPPEAPRMPEPAAPVEPAPLPRLRPDRAKMDQTSLDRSASRQLMRVFRRERKGRQRIERAFRMDRWLFRLVLGLLGTAMAMGAFRMIRARHLGGSASGAEENSLTGPSAPAVQPLHLRASVLLENFLAAKGAEAKAAFVLDPERVLPLMRKCYDTTRGASLPEDRLVAEVALPVERGLVTVPCLVTGRGGFELDILIKEKDGRAGLDWETYEQEMNRSLARYLESPAAASAAGKGSPGMDLRVMLERSHGFGGVAGEGNPAVAVSFPGSGAGAKPVAVAPEAVAAVTSGLEWNRRRRALVRLEWETAAGRPPRLVLRELVRWDFLP